MRATPAREERLNHGQVADIPVRQRAAVHAVRSLGTGKRSLGEIDPKRKLWLASGTVALLVVALFAIAKIPAPARIAPPASASPTPRTTALTPTASGGGLFVHVAGAVRKPGLYELGPEARVADAIEAAGGALQQAELDLVNLAQLLTDGMKIEVPLAGAPASAGVASTDAEGTALVSINSAALEELETLPGVGPVTAQAIISHREEAGPFASLEDLLEVSGIGPATFAEIRPHVTL